MEFEAQTARAYGRKCVGCELHGKEVMLSFGVNHGGLSTVIHDVFLTQSQAESLMRELVGVISRNKIKEKHK